MTALEEAFSSLNVTDQSDHDSFITDLSIDPFNDRSSQRGQRDGFKSQSAEDVLRARPKDLSKSEPSSNFQWVEKRNRLIRVVPVYTAFSYHAAGVMAAVTNPTHWGRSDLRTVFFSGIANSKDVIGKESIYGTVASHCSLESALQWYYTNVCTARAKKGAKPQLRMYFVSKHSYGVERSYTVLLSYREHPDLVKADAVVVPASPAAADSDPHLVEFVGSTDDGFADAHFLFRPCSSDFKGGRSDWTLLTLAFHFPKLQKASQEASLQGFPMTCFKTKFVNKKDPSVSFPQDLDVRADVAEVALKRAVQLFKGVEYSEAEQQKMDTFIRTAIQKMLKEYGRANLFRREGVTNEQWQTRKQGTLMTPQAAARSYLGLYTVSQLAQAKASAGDSLLHIHRLFKDKEDRSEIFGQAPFVDDSKWRQNVRAGFKSFKTAAQNSLDKLIKEKPKKTTVTDAITDYCWLMAMIAYDRDSRYAWKQMLCLLAIPIDESGSD